MWTLILALLLISRVSDGQVPDSADGWEELVSSNGVKFTARNGESLLLLLLSVGFFLELRTNVSDPPAHASCIFKKRIWVVGGRTNSYVDYNLLTNYRRADVWYSYDGGM